MSYKQKKQHFEEILLIPKTVHVGFFVCSWSTHHRTLGLLKHFHLPGLEGIKQLSRWQVSQKDELLVSFDAYQRNNNGNGTKENKNSRQVFELFYDQWAEDQQLDKQERRSFFSLDLVISSDNLDSLLPTRTCFWREHASKSLKNLI